MRRFRLPIPTRVQVHEGRPVRLVIDRNGFTSGAIAQAAGPWRTSGEWWTTGSAAPGAWDRDEWEIAMNDGTVYRLFVEREVGQWFVEGVID
jgi:protein ImuB